MNITWDSSKNKTNISDSAFKDLLADPTENSVLTSEDKEFILTSFNAKMYNYVVEYVYNKAVKILQDTVFSIGEDIVVSVIHWIDRSVISNFFDVFVLRLAHDLDLINGEQKITILQIIAYLQAKKDAFIDSEDLNKEKTKYYISVLYDAILSKDYSSFIKNIKQILDDLQTKEITVDSELYQNMLSITNKHKNILLRIMFAMLKNSDHMDAKNVKNLCKNMKNLIEDLWEKATLNDKKFFAYYIKTLPTDSSVFKRFDSVLEGIKVNDFTTDLSVVTEILKDCQDILSSHYSVNNQKDEVVGLARLSEVNSFPKFFLRSAITPCLVTYLGNENGPISESREYAEKVLNQISSDKWEFYFKNFFLLDDFVLINLISVPDCLKDWCQIIKRADINIDNVDNEEVKQLLTASKRNDFEKIVECAKTILFAS